MKVNTSSVIPMNTGMLMRMRRMMKVVTDRQLRSGMWLGGWNGGGAKPLRPLIRVIDPGTD